NRENDQGANKSNPRARKCNGRLGSSNGHRCVDCSDGGSTPRQEHGAIPTSDVDDAVLPPAIIGPEKAPRLRARRPSARPPHGASSLSTEPDTRRFCNFTRRFITCHVESLAFHHRDLRRGGRWDDSSLCVGSCSG